MKDVLWKILCSAAAFTIVLAVPARAQNTDNDGCTNATLQGDYGFTIHGESLGVLVPQTSGPPKLAPFANALLVDGVAMTHFDGIRNLTQVDVVMRNGTSAATPATPVSNGFRTGETGSYSLNTDCTGTFRINFPDGTEIDVVFVLAKQGHEIHTVVTRQHVPQLPPTILPAGVSCDATTNGCDLGVQIRSDGVKYAAWWESALFD